MTTLIKLTADQQEEIDEIEWLNEDSLMDEIEDIDNTAMESIKDIRTCAREEIREARRVSKKETCDEIKELIDSWSD